MNAKVTVLTVDLETVHFDLGQELDLTIVSGKMIFEVKLNILLEICENLNSTLLTNKVWMSLVLTSVKHTFIKNHQIDFLVSKLT